MITDEHRKGEKLNFEIMVLRERIDILELLIETAEVELSTIAKLTGMLVLQSPKLRHVVHQIHDVKEAMIHVDDTFRTLEIAP